LDALADWLEKPPEPQTMLEEIVEAETMLQATRPKKP
jgi:hypothetical protein